MFTAVLPAYNHQQFLHECVMSACRSILVTEVLIVDDGSTDKTQSIIGQLQGLSPKVRVLKDKLGNMGAHNRLNELVLAASNDWIAVLNTDDLFVAGRFDAIQRIVSNSSAELFFGDLILIDGEGKRIGFRNSIRDNEHEWPDNVNSQMLLEQEDWLPLLAIQNLAATTTNMIFTKNLHQQISGFKNYRYCHDWDFIIRASAVKDRVSYIPTMLSKYRLHANNTIKEDKAKVIYDVRKMFCNLKTDMPELFDDEKLQSKFNSNRYLNQIGNSFIALILKEKSYTSIIAKKISDLNLPIEIYFQLEEIPEHITHYSILNFEECSVIQSDQLASIVMTLSLRKYDRLVVGIPTKESISGKFYVLEFLKRSTQSQNEPSTRVVGLGGIRTRIILDKLGLVDNAEIDCTKYDCSTNSCRNEEWTIPRSPILKCDHRPLVFVLPAFLAVGGVERLILDTITLLKSEYRFVVVNTEPLRFEQGSMHDQYGETHIFDLPEIAREEDYILALSYLKTLYEPNLIWICNGAPWQVAHSVEIRKIFDNVPIINHMAYDHNAGWINCFGDKGIAESDRFVAINNQIKNVMTSKFKISPASIDLIYHGTDLRRFSGQMADPEKKVRRKHELELDPGKLLFGMVGRLTSQKRPLDIIALAKRFPDSEFVWVGLGELEEQFALEAAMVPNVRLYKARKDLIPIYQALDGLIVCSEFEGLPLVLLEALSMGVPALSSDVGAIEEVLSEYQAGTVFTPPGDISKLHTSFVLFKDSIEFFSKNARSCAARVSVDFSSDRMASNYAECFRVAINDKINSRKEEFRNNILR